MTQSTTALDRVEYLTDQIGERFLFLQTRYNRDTQEYDPVPGTVERVKFPWDEWEWCFVAMRERNGYVGGCCGNMSLLQDHVNNVFRNGGYADAHELLTIGELARDHDGFELFEAMDDERFIEVVGKWRDAREYDTRLDPWKTLGIIFNAAEGKLAPSWTETPNRWQGKDETEYERGEIMREDAVHILADTLDRMRWADMFGGRSEEDQFAAGHEAAMTILKARALPALRATLTELEKDEGFSFEGFAVLRKGEDEPMSAVGGLCLFRERERAEELISGWVKAEEHTERARNEDAPGGKISEHVEIVPCTVSVREGLVLHRENGEEGS